MSPKTRHTLIVGVAAVAIAAIGGIAAIEGWLPERFSGETPAAIAPPGLQVTGTAPPESLSPGESVVSAPPKTPEKAAEKAPEKAPPVPKPAAPKRPVAPPSHRYCANCGTVSSTAYHEREPRGAAWEVRVKFDDGSRKILRYPTDPGFRVGDRVFFSSGRLHKD